VSSPTETGHIVAYLTLEDTEWRRSIDRAKRDLDALRAQGDVDLRIRLDDNGAAASLAAIRAELRGLRASARTDINIRTNARQTSSELQGTRKQANLLMDAIVLLGSAAVPVAAVAGGALAGLLPVAISTALGIKGISEELKSGALEGTEAAADIGVLKRELTNLKAITAGGLLTGLHSGLADADPLFRTLNTDAHVMSTQVGQIASNTVPALLTVLTQLNPLFSTIGSELIRGSEGFERWAQSSDGVSKFVSYVQSELPAVEHTLGSLLTLVSHLGQGLGPIGGLTLTSIGVLADAINSLPIGVLQTLLPLLVATRVSMLAYRGVTAVMGLASSAYTRAAGTAQVFGSTTMTAHMQAAASSSAAAATIAASAASTAQAELRTATAAVSAAEAQVAAAATGTAAQRAQAEAALAAATTQQSAAARTAAVTQAASVRAAGAAEANAARTVAAGRVAATGWAAALGPIGALAIGVTLLGTAFMGSSHGTEQATQANQSYAESVKQSTNALNEANTATTIKNLSDAKAYEQLNKIQNANALTTMSNNDLMLAVNGTQKQYDDFSKAIVDADAHLDSNTKTGADAINTTGDLSVTVMHLREALHGNIDQQKLYNQAIAEARTQQHGGSDAARAMAASLGLTGPAYLKAAAAARDSTSQTNAQTAAFQLANDAASLFRQTLDLLNGKSLNVAQAQTTMASANLSVAKSFKDNGTAINGNTAAAVSNQQSIQQAVQSAQQYAEAIGKQTGSSDQATAAYRRSKDSLEDQLRAQGKLTPAVQKYIDKLYDLSNVKVPPTKIDVNDRAAHAKIGQIQGLIDRIKQGKVPGLDADSRRGRDAIRVLQGQINALRGKRVTADAITAGGISNVRELQAWLDSLHDRTVNVTVRRNSSGASIGKDTGNPVTGTRARAAGGPVVGRGTGTSDEVPALYTGPDGVIPYRLSNGEWIANAAATAKNRGPLEAANRGATLAVVHTMATGGPVGGITKKGSGKDATWKFGGQTYQSATAAHNARNRAIQTEMRLIATIDTSGLAAFDRALDGTVDQAQTAFRTLYESLNKAGGSDRLLKNLRAANGQLDAIIAHRQRLRDTLGGPAQGPTAYDALQTAKSNRAQEASSVSSRAQGAFSVASGGAGANGEAPTAGSMVAGGLQAATLVERFYRGITTLSKGTLGRSATGRQMIQQLFEEGPGAYPQLQALLKETPRQLSMQVSAQARINAASSGLGALAGKQVYGAQVSAAQSRVDTLRAQIAADDRRADRQGKVIARAVRAGLKDLRVDLDSKKVSKGTKTGSNKNARRK
jgi:hypothetical protein